MKLSHGSIAQVLDMGLHEGEAYMALEYVDGKDLRKVAGRVRDRQMPLPLTFILYVMGRVLDALAYAHRKRDDDEKELKLVHRDISPQNILISYEGEVKVIDFGLAKSRLSAAKTNPSIILGKFLYMSPEQARHQPVDRRSDLYAVGLCLYELISGKNPFDTVPPGELMPTVASPRIPPLNEVEPMTPPSVAQLVMKALAVDPAQRFQTAEEFRGKLQGCLLEIDTNAGPETVSRFMRDLFSTEFQGERKLLAQLKDVARGSEPAGRPLSPMDQMARMPNPALPPRTIKLDGPVEPLSFQPTPRSRDGRPVDDGDTRPGIPQEESTRPAATVSSPEPVSRSRVRPGPSSLASATTETADIEVRPEDFDRPGPPVPPPAATSARSMAPTVEVPIPLVPAAAIPPGVPPPASLASASAPRPGEVPRVAAPPPAPMASAPSPKASEPPRPAGQPPPLAGAQSARPSGPARPEPRSAELARAGAPTLQIPSPFLPEETPRAPSPVLTTPPLPSFSSLMPAPAPPSRETTDPHGVPPPVFTLPPLSSAPAEPPTPPRESGRSSGLRAALHERGAASSRSEPMSLAEEVAAAAAAAAAKASQPARAPEAQSAMSLVAEMTAGGSAEASRRGVDDTHPSYKVKADSPLMHDTQPGVVLDEQALANMGAEGSQQPIVGGLLEEPQSVPARSKSARRTRASSSGMPSVGRANSSGRSGVMRALDTEAPAEPESSEPESGVGNTDLDVEMDADVPARDPRDETRRTPIPTRPGEPRGRIHREEPRRAPAAPASQKKRSWVGLVVTVLVLGAVGGALAMTYPTLKPMLDQYLATPEVKPPPAVPLNPKPAEPGDGVVPVPGDVAPGEGVPSGEAAVAPGQPGAELTPEDTDMLVPLTAPSSTPTAKKPPVRPPRKGSRKDSDLQKEWGATSRAFIKLTDLQSCESPKVGILCKKFESLQNDVDAAGDSNDKDLLGRVKKMRAEIQKAMSAAQ